MKRGPISHGDLLLGLRAVGATDEATTATVAKLLGFANEAAAAAAEEPIQPGGTAAADPSFNAETPAPVVPPVSVGRRHTTAKQVGFELSGPRTYRSTPPAWLSVAKPLEVSSPSTTTRPPEPLPLLEPRWARNILATLLAKQQSDGPLDLEELVHTIARREWPAALPRVRRFAPRGVQLLVDISDGMTPFAADQRTIIQLLSRLLGTDRMSTLEFGGSPASRIHDASSDEWRPFGERDYPPVGTPVLALTDLGIGRPPLAPVYGTTADWTRFALAMAQRGSTLIALVPYGEKRWPIGLRRVMRIVAWDRMTTVRTVRFQRSGG